MNENDLLGRWAEARRQLIISQLGPTGLLITTVGLLQFGLADSSLAVRVAAAGILLASGILGALAQYSVATEAGVIARELASTSTALSRSIVGMGKWTAVPRFITPAIFIVIFVAIVAALFVPGA